MSSMKELVFRLAANDKEIMDIFADFSPEDRSKILRLFELILLGKHQSPSPG